jgi:NAD(P)H-flavin reductase
LHRLGPGETLGIRGPFGRGFPVRKLGGNDLLIVAGGLGIVPLRSLIHYIMDNRRDFGKVSILMGCQTPQNILFHDEIKLWEERLDMNFACTVDRADPEWKGNVGLITSLIPQVSVFPARTYAVVVGPPVMYKFVIAELLKKNIAPERILLSLERHMKCGLGKCGHCQINKFYCCQDGPVFSYAEIHELEEAFD